MEVITTLYKYNSMYKRFEYYESELIYLDGNMTIENIFKKMTQKDNDTINKTYIMMTSEFGNTRIDLYIIKTNKEGSIHKITTLQNLLKLK
jgi:hypothetical protein